MSRRNLPPLEVGKAYVATDFESFEYWYGKLTGSKAILRLHLKNETTIDLPAKDENLKYLGATLAAAFPEYVLQYFFANGWAKKP